MTTQMMTRPSEFSSRSDMHDAVQEFASGPVRDAAAAIDRESAIPSTLVDALVELRLFAFDRLKDHEPPMERSQAARLVIEAIEALARFSPPVAKLVLDHNFGQVSMLKAFVRPELRSELIGEIQRGDSQIAFLMTEPSGGSTATDLRSHVTRREGGVELAGTKDWATGADERNLYLVVARDGNSDSARFGLFLIRGYDAGRPPSAVVLGDRKEKLGMRGLNEFTVELPNVFIPEEHVVLAPSPTGLRQIMHHYNFKRAAEAAIAIGIARSALGFAYSYQQARALGPRRSIAPTAKFSFAECYAQVELAAGAVERATKDLYHHQTGEVTGAIAKLAATETAVAVTNTALQLCGAVGTSREIPVERLLRDARMLTIAGGASEVLKSTIARRLPSLLAPLPEEAEMPWA